jgi:UDP-glucose 4-epimerase
MTENYDVFNIWTGKWTSVFEMISMLSEISKRKIPYSMAARRPWDLAEVYADGKKAENILGWKAKKTVYEWIAGSWKFASNNS